MRLNNFWLLLILMLLASFSLMSLPQSIFAVGGAGSEEPPPAEPPPAEPPPAEPPPEVYNPWVPYGYAFPTDPVYGFGYADPATKDLLGLAAKGNIVIGDYTSQEFQDRVVPKLSPGINSVVQPYTVDPTDVALGYDNAPAIECYGQSPCFSGNYTLFDGGTKLDDSPRRFYESSLPDPEFQQLVGGVDPSRLILDAVLFTNHALAGDIPQTDFYIRGAAIARDEAMMFYASISISHDIRLLGDTMSDAVVLPFSLRRPRLVSRRDLP